MELTFLLLNLFQVKNYQGPARVVVQLVTALNQTPQLHAHSLVGKQCDKGICMVDLQPKDSSIRCAGPPPDHTQDPEEDSPPPPPSVSFPNLGILHVTKKNVTKTLEERMMEAFRLGHNYGVSIHPEIDSQQGEVRVPRELSGQSPAPPPRVCVCFPSLAKPSSPCPPLQTISAS